MKKENILIVDDNFDMLEVLQRQLASMNFHIYKASSVLEAIEILKSSTVDLLITDLQMPKINGMELVKYASEHFPDLPKLVITGFPSIAGAVDAVKSGAIDYLVKPFTNDELKKAVEKSLQNRRIIGQVNPKTSIKDLERSSYGGIIGQSDEILEVIDIIERVKNNRATVLLQGESGTGKELVARAIHYKGAFAKNPFIAVNCGAIPENLLEAELFGFVKGSFTGAAETRDGFFQAANGGTIFLDEIGNAPQTVQTRLLRVLQEKEVTMIGSQHSEKINVRVIAATNSNLHQMVRSGSFREDLYYRLNVVNILVPPLRDRKEDIPAIVNTFLKKYGTEFQKNQISISEPALQLLMRHSWPGNIRELENVIQRSVIMSETIIEMENLPDYLKAPIPHENEDPKSESLEDVERQHILKVLAAVNNNKTKAAEILKIDRKTLRQKLK